MGLFFSNYLHCGSVCTERRVKKKKKMKDLWKLTGTDLFEGTCVVPLTTGRVKNGLIKSRRENGGDGKRAH